MNKRDADEFRTVIAALAEEYGASREDVIAAAEALPPHDGRPPIDDHEAVGEAVRMRLDGRAPTDWAAARAVAARRAGHSVAATEQRLYRKMRSPRGFFNRFPFAARVIVGPDDPFARARRALAKIPGFNIK
jgi:hypothetical protein